MTPGGVTGKVTRMGTPLASAPLDTWVTISRVTLEGEAAAWVAAVGLHDGEALVVLRRAALGGPLHVRTGSGGEFAIGREVADRIEVEPVAEEPA